MREISAVSKTILSLNVFTQSIFSGPVFFTEFTTSVNTAAVVTLVTCMIPIDISKDRATCAWVVDDGVFGIASFALVIVKVSEDLFVHEAISCAVTTQEELYCCKSTWNG